MNNMLNVIKYLKCLQVFYYAHHVFFFKVCRNILVCYMSYELMVANCYCEPHMSNHQPQSDQQSDNAEQTSLKKSLDENKDQGKSIREIRISKLNACIAIAFFTVFTGVIGYTIVTGHFPSYYCNRFISNIMEALRYKLDISEPDPDRAVHANNIPVDQRIYADIREDGTWNKNGLVYKLWDFDNQENIRKVLTSIGIPYDIKMLVRDGKRVIIRFEPTKKEEVQLDNGWTEFPESHE